MGWVPWSCHASDFWCLRLKCSKVTLSESNTMGIKRFTGLRSVLCLHLHIEIWNALRASWRAVMVSKTQIYMWCNNIRLDAHTVQDVLSTYGSQSGDWRCSPETEAETQKAALNWDLGLALWESFVWWHSTLYKQMNSKDNEIVRHRFLGHGGILFLPVLDTY